MLAVESDNSWRTRNFCGKGQVTHPERNRWGFTSVSAGAASSAKTEERGKNSPLSFRLLGPPGMYAACFSCHGLRPYPAGLLRLSNLAPPGSLVARTLIMPSLSLPIVPSARARFFCARLPRESFSAPSVSSPCPCGAVRPSCQLPG